MHRNQIFVRRRDGRIEVRLSDEGRAFVREQFGRLRVADEDEHHEWHLSLHQPIDPGLDDDDPLRSLERQRAMASNAELALLTADEQFLNEGEAWAWLSSLQLALRAVASLAGLLTADDVTKRPDEELVEVYALQQLLFDLSEAVS
jgi:hypothetical protein